jgi:hypothetical protein
MSGAIADRTPNVIDRPVRLVRVAARFKGIPPKDEAARVRCCSIACHRRQWSRIVIIGAPSPSARPAKHRRSAGFWDQYSVYPNCACRQNTLSAVWTRHWVQVTLQITLLTLSPVNRCRSAGRRGTCFFLRTATVSASSVVKCASIDRLIGIA